MKHSAYLVVVLVAAWGLAHPAAAEPAWGSNCLSCHGEWFTETIYVVGEDLIADPDESQTGAPDRGPLPVFQTFPGRTKSFQATVGGLQAGDRYTVSVRRFRYPGVEHGGTLTYTGDCAWAEWGDVGRWYSNPVVSYLWGTGPTDFTFNIDVGLDADYDYYDLILAVAGRRQSDQELFYAEEHFYVQVVLGPGDLNCDGSINGTDIDAFVLALTDPTGYGTTYPGCDIDRADCNGDGTVNGLDVDAFVTLLGSS